MKAFELYTKEGKKTDVWVCKKCKIVSRAENQAEACCKCVDCGKEERSPHRTRCEACSKKYHEKMNAEQKQKEQDVMKIAEIVDEEFGLFYGETYLKNVEDIESELYPDDVAPEFCFAAKPVLFRKWSIDEVMDSEDEQYELEDAGEIQFAGMDALRKAFDDFNATNAGLAMCYTVDYTKKVKVRDD